jgi:hypothetical protein
MNAAITGLVVALVTLAACGGDSSSEGDLADPVSGLSAHVPADSTLLAVVDVDAARAELGLAADTDALDNEALAGGNALEQPQGKLLVATALGIPPLNFFLQTLEPDPVVEALDGAAISAAASNQGDPEQAVSPGA